MSAASLAVDPQCPDLKFLGGNGFDPALETQLDSHARVLRRTVEQWTGIPVSVGIATTK